MEFLGNSATEWENEGCYSFEIQGQLLRYQIFVDEISETVFISGDDKFPFQPRSLYEISVHCNLIRLQSGDDPNQKALSFWFGPPEDQYSLRLMLLKRPGGDLTVWPGVCFPPSMEHRTRMEQNWELRFTKPSASSAEAEETTGEY